MDVSYVRTNWVSEVTPTSPTNMNNIEQALDAIYNKSAFKVYRNAAFNISDGTQLQFDTAEFDPATLYKLTGPQASLFVCQTAGLWRFSCLYAVNGAPGALDTYYAVRFYKNGLAGQLYEGERIPNRGYSLDVPGETWASLAVGDTFEARVTVGAAIAATPLITGPGRTWFAGKLEQPL